MRTTFYVALHTEQQYDAAEYVEAAGATAELLQPLVGPKEALTRLTHSAPLTAAHAAVEISHAPEAGLVGVCVLDLDAAGRVTLDKRKLTAAAKAGGVWSDIRVEKRLVPQANSEVGSKSPQ